jgi:hypothetical protein
VKLLNHKTTEPVVGHIERAFPKLPENVRVVPPESGVNSYVIASLASVVLTYTSTLGLEMACQGMPVAVGGTAHYARRGFTVEADTADGYFSAVEGLLAAPPDDADRLAQQELAYRYASLFFYRFHQTLAAIDEPGRSRVRLRARSAAELAPGVDPALDRVVDAVLSGEEPLVAPLAC